MTLPMRTIIPASLLIGIVGVLLCPWLTALPFIDAVFGVAFWVADVAGVWRPGPSWIERHRALAIFCVVVWPFVASTAVAIGSACAWQRVVRRGRVPIWAAGTFVVALVVVVGLASQTAVVSWRGYLGSNY
jgi:hypothetical protein